ncbi:CTP synthase [Acetitomaculum ruminis DSM 5522]|uniref:CTP synthase n=1 Tax=Acetitomaculum ruminis DSM 5522 TaxID=1120918 RepID=A0A1I0XYH9_9FIRM|nr:CTP synthase [Acetitomaculum ruminis]SFB06189.1 CTP synthase [Acetitomaculum ruminis DSM 5522]
MAVKYVFVTGGVVSGLGKGITAASLGRLLKARGYRVTMQKFDPYINIDPGTMNPIQHGEVFVTDDGAETDLDLGHYERFIDESLNKNSNVTTGKIYWSVLQKERRGDFGGGTVQVIPHITNEIKSRFYRDYSSDDVSIAIIEVGGTVGDMESQPFLEAIRQFQHDVGHDNAILIHVTLIPYLKASGEMKTKPTQASVKELQGMGIQPDIIVCRTEHPLDDSIKDKISLFCNIPSSNVLQNLDVEYLYEAPLAMEKEHLAQVACECLKLDCPKPDLEEWTAMVNQLRNPVKDVKIALVGKYISLHDAYISVVEALKHGGISSASTVSIKWVDSETVTPENVKEILGDVSGILVPGGFGSRGIEGKITAIQYARENNVPFLGLCLGMQLAIVEFARNVVGYKDAQSIELAPNTTHPVISLMPEQEDIENIGGTLRLGSYPCNLKEGTKAYEAYGEKTIHERHRHRYEVNNDYRKALTDAGMTLSGISPDGRIVEMIEITQHPWFVATQAHPELKSRPNRPHPLFKGFVQASINYMENK